jgi:glycosyltransferase involved in cell wall biosynthesis
MNFLFFAGGASLHGMEIVLHSLMRGLNERGHQATAIVSGWNNGDYPRMLGASGIDYREVELGRFYLRRPNWSRGTYYSLGPALAEIRETVRRTKPDWLIFSDAQALLFCSWILPSANKALYLHSKPEMLLGYPFGIAIRRRIKRVVCVSDFVARCAERTPLWASDISVVHNGVAAPLAPRRRSATRPVHLQPVHLGIIGTPSRQKQHLILLRAVERVRRRLPADSFRLSIIGSRQGRFVGTVEAKIAELGLRDTVRWTGFVTDRDEIYDDLDILVAPAIDEGFGLSIVEAGAYGLPVVAARSGAFPEVVQEGRTGLLFEPGDVAALALALERLILDGDLRASMGVAGQAQAQRLFTVDRMVDGFVRAMDGAG